MAKMKIYEIVSSMQRQFPDLQNKDVVTLLQENGFDVKGSQSVIEDDAIGFLLKHAKEHLANLKKSEHAKKKDTKKAETPKKKEEKAENTSASEKAAVKEKAKKEEVKPEVKNTVEENKDTKSEKGQEKTVAAETEENKMQETEEKGKEETVKQEEKKEVLKYVHFLKANEHEMEVLTGYTDAVNAGKVIYDWGVKEVLLTFGSMGSIIYDGSTFHKIPAYIPKEVVNATGAGDTYMTGYLYKRAKGASIEEAGRFAAAMTTLKIEGIGPFNGTKEDVLRCLETAEQRMPE